MSTLFPWTLLVPQNATSLTSVIEIRIKLTPKAAHNRIQGIHYDAKGVAFLKVSVTSPPLDGLANEALIAFLAKKLNCAKSTLSLRRGQTDRWKYLHWYSPISGSSDDILSLVQRALLP